MQLINIFTYFIVDQRSCSCLDYLQPTQKESGYCPKTYRPVGPPWKQQRQVQGKYFYKWFKTRPLLNELLTL
jgi:hypothetical protein